jgi:hypothetical protein
MEDWRHNTISLGNRVGYRDTIKFHAIRAGIASKIDSDQFFKPSLGRDKLKIPNDRNYNSQRRWSRICESLKQIPELNIMKPNGSVSDGQEDEKVVRE